MAEVQIHGNLFEDKIIYEYTGLHKTEYQKLITQGYTSPFDMVDGVKVIGNWNVKTTGSDGIGCGDILRFYDHLDKFSFTMIVGKYTQQGNQKIYDRIYEFYFEPKDMKVVFSNIPRNVLKNFDDYVKSIPYGKAGQTANRKIWKEKRKEILDNHDPCLISINAKIDSKVQRRVQCGLKISDLIKHIPYKIYTENYVGINLPYVQNSPPRSR